MIDFTQRIDFEGPIQKARNKNAKEIQRESNLCSPDFKQKVINFSERWGFEPEYIFRRIQTDWMFALQFTKDPGRQSIHQKIASDFIQSLSKIVIDFKKLDNGGSKSKHIIEGNIISEATRTGHKKRKTIDFEWSCPTINDTPPLKFYASHKFTKDEGGAQDNQYSDIKNFRDHAREAKSHDEFFLAIVDGAYYLREDLDAAPKTRIQVLNSGRDEDSRYRACSSNQLAWVITTEFKKWAIAKKQEAHFKELWEGLPSVIPEP